MRQNRRWILSLALLAMANILGGCSSKPAESDTAVVDPDPAVKPAPTPAPVVPPTPTPAAPQPDAKVEPKP